MFKEDEVILKETARYSEKDTLDHVASVSYAIVLKKYRFKVGNIDLRLTMNDYMYYYGHIGYHIYYFCRGHRYAYKACLLLGKIAKEEFGMKELIITTDPDNLASLKTIQRLNASFIEKVHVPKGHDLYKRKEKEKLIYKWVL